MTTPTTYDDVIYHTRPRRSTHIDTQATIAALMGLNSPPVTNCRVLELGCGTGGNLTPMAATLPGSRFVGIDLSAVQIDLAKQFVAKLGLTNIEYRADSVMDLSEKDGEFDYIIAHGLYSWVPPMVQDKILEICSKNLSPNGVAYISYNTYPGWHFRGPVREMMNWFVRDIPDAAEKVRAARGFIAYLAQAIPDQTDTYAVNVRAEAEQLAKEPDYYLYHEHLEADNRPLYFHEFMTLADAKGLQFLGEAEHQNRTRELSDETRKALAAATKNIVELEQHHDFLWNRTFRRTLLCQKSASVPRQSNAAILDRMLATSTMRPTNPSPDLSPGVEEGFESFSGTTMSTNSPMVKTLLVTLFQAWPQSVRIHDLIPPIAAQLGPLWEENPRRSLASFFQTIVEFFQTGLLDLHTHMPEFVRVPGEKPVAYSVARLLESRNGLVPTLRHQEVPIGPVEQILLPLLDGTRDRAALVAAITDAIRVGRLVPPPGDTTTPDEVVQQSLTRLGASAILLA